MTRAIDTSIDVVTPENISFRYEVAGPFRRFLALLIDVVLRVGVWLGFLLLTMFSGVMAFIDETFIVALWLVAWFVMEWFYGGLFETFWNGQTPGKRLLGLRVLQANGQPVTGLQAVVRNILRTVDLMPLMPLAPFVDEQIPFALPTALVGFATMALTNRFQRLGDLVCNTMVVSEPKKWLAHLMEVRDPRALELARQLPPQIRLSRQQARAVAAYVDRRGVFSLEHRREVARNFAEPLCELWQLPPETDPDLLLCAVYHRVFITDRQDAEEWFASVDGGQASSGSSTTNVSATPLRELREPVVTAHPVAAAISGPARPPAAPINPGGDSAPNTTAAPLNAERGPGA